MPPWRQDQREVTDHFFFPAPTLCPVSRWLVFPWTAPPTVLSTPTNPGLMRTVVRQSREGSGFVGTERVVGLETLQ